MDLWSHEGQGEQLMAEKYDYYDTTFFLFFGLLHQHTATHGIGVQIGITIIVAPERLLSVERAVLHWKRDFLFGFVFLLVHTHL
jgi:hypothetical protein